jgi:CheY-like chemotaxis protein
MGRRQFQVMVTGRLGEVTRDLCEHMERDRQYAAAECPPKKSALLKATLERAPQVIIICLRGETPKTVRVFDILTESEKAGEVTFIVVANEEDAEVFTKTTALRRAVLLSRPLHLSALYDKLRELETHWRAAEKEAAASFTEFVRPEDRVVFPRRHILVVDDEPEQLIQIREHLQEFYETTLVGSGKGALNYLDRFKVDLILLDYMMPIMDGPEVLKKIWETKGWEDIPVIFLTGVSEKDKVLKTLSELRPQGYLIKPSKKSELVAKIIDVVG